MKYKNGQKVCFVDIQTGKETIGTLNFFTSKPSVSENQRVATTLMKLADEIDKLALSLHNLGGCRGVDGKLCSYLEAKAEVLSGVSSDILATIE